MLYSKSLPRMSCGAVELVDVASDLLVASAAPTSREPLDRHADITKLSDERMSFGRSL